MSYNIFFFLKTLSVPSVFPVLIRFFMMVHLQITRIIMGHVTTNRSIDFGSRTEVTEATTFSKLHSRYYLEVSQQICG